MSVGSVTDPFSSLGLALQDTSAKRTELGQDAFLKLMTTQLQYQDPFKPMDSGDFLGQIAQFSTVSGIQSMNQSLTDLSSSLTSNQTLQAAALVGHGVLVPSDSGYLFSEGSMTAGAELPSSGSLSVDITDASGALVRHIDLGAQPAGTAKFTWDGLDDAGNRMSEGTYGIKASLETGGASTAVDTYAAGLVGSVTLGSSGLTLNLYGMDSAALADVHEIL